MDPCAVCLQVELAYSQVRGDWEAEAASHYLSVIAAALEASSTDNEHQTAGEGAGQHVQLAQLSPSCVPCRSCRPQQL